MLLTVLDSTGATKTVCVQSQGSGTDRSGTISIASTSQQLMAANGSRSGWFVQNTTLNVPMTVNELGGDATNASSVVLNFGDVFPPPGYPVSTGIINIACGTPGATFVAREY